MKNIDTEKAAVDFVIDYYRRCGIELIRSKGEKGYYLRDKEGNLFIEVKGTGKKSFLRYCSDISQTENMKRLKTA